MMRWQGPRSVLVPSAIVLIAAAATGVTVRTRYPTSTFVAAEIDRQAWARIRTSVEDSPLTGVASFHMVANEQQVVNGRTKRESPVDRSRKMDPSSSRGPAARLVHRMPAPE